MSISTQRSLAQLKNECNRLGLTVNQSGKRESKTDYILALREFHLKNDFPNGIPKSLELILKIESPMLCNRFNNLSPEEQDAIWNSDEWILEQKEDGARMTPIFVNGKFDFFSRNISVTDFLPISYRDNIWTGDWDLSKIEDEFIIDSEIISSNPNISTVIGKRGVVTETQLQAVTALLAMNPEDSVAIQKNEGCPLEFRVFDVLWWNGEWIMDKPLIERMEYVLKAIAQLNAAGIKARRPYSTFSNKKAFYKTLLSMGCEGCVAKNIMSPYIPSSSRRKDGFVKIKRKMSESMQLDGIGDTIDAFITGYEPADETKSWAGLIGALEFSLFVRDEQGNEREHKIARITNISMDLRKEITDFDAEGNPILKKEWYGKVASVDGQCISAREKRLKHAVLVEWRPDRDPSSCILDEEYLNKMIL